MMNQGRLTHISSELAEWVQRSSPEQRSEGVRRVCILAVLHTGVTDRRIAEAMRFLERDDQPDDTTVGDIAKLAEELDEKAWDLQEAEESGQGGDAEYSRAFAQARAVAAVAFALTRSTESDSDALYEAYHAINDHGTFMQELAK